MASVSLQVTRGKTFTSGPVTAADLNLAAAPQVEIPEGANIGPEHLNVSAVAAAIGSSSRPVNWAPNPAYLPGFWQAPAGIAVAAGTRRENARDWEVAPTGGAAQYAQTTSTPDANSSTSAQINGGAGVTGVDFGFYLDHNGAGMLRGEAALCFSVYIYNGGGAAWTPQLIVQPSSVAGVPGGGAETVLTNSANALPVSQWLRCTWTIPASTIPTFANGVRIMIRIPGAVMNNIGKFNQFAQAQLEIGTAPSGFMKSPVAMAEDLLAIGSTQLWFGLTPLPGWLWCDGAAYAQGDYPQLFALLGTRYGSGGAGTFKVPDVRESLLAGAGIMPGSGAASPNRLRVAVEGCSLGAGDTWVTVPDRSRLAVGMGVYGAGVAAGAVVTKFSGTDRVHISAANEEGLGPVTLYFTRTLADPTVVTGAPPAPAGGRRTQAEMEVRGCSTTVSVFDVTLPSAAAADAVAIGSVVIAANLPTGTVVVARKTTTVLVLSAAATSTLAGSATLKFVHPAAAGELIPPVVLDQCATTSTSTTVTVPTTTGLRAGMPVSGTGIPAGAFIASITDGTTLVLSAAATATGASVRLTFTAGATESVTGPDTLLPIMSIPLIIKAA